jgi:hypothetical protein
MLSVPERFTVFFSVFQSTDRAIPHVTFLTRGRYAHEVFPVAFTCYQAFQSFLPAELWEKTYICRIHGVISDYLIPRLIIDNPAHSVWGVLIDKLERRKNGSVILV